MLSEFGYEKFVRPRLFGFSSDPEEAHKRVMGYLQGVHRHPWALKALRLALGSDSPNLAQTFWGMRFPNPVGLPGGMDKNGLVPNIWPAIGFGFFELGTVVAEEQMGNPRPRIFRLEQDKALINRMGFNSDGADVVATRLNIHFWKGRLPLEPMFINIGKSKKTPLDKASRDYLYSFEKLYLYACGFVINVSSPNTPDLRQLQDVDKLKELLEALIAKNKKLANQYKANPKPLLVKIAPDLSRGAIDDVINICKELGIQGLIATNTTTERRGLKTSINEEGGLSGPSLFGKAHAIVRYIRQRVDEDFVIIGVGGISGSEDAWRMLEAGANLVQVYTALVYQGPFLPKMINQGLRLKLREHGFKNISEVRALWPRTL